MEGVRVQSQARRSQPPTAVRRAVSTAYRLANLVRSDGVARGVSVDAAFSLDTSPQRSRHTLAPGKQSLSRRAASLHSRATLSLSARADWRENVVETRTNRQMAASALHRRSTVSSVAGSNGLAGLKIDNFKRDTAYEVCSSDQLKFLRMHR